MGNSSLHGFERVTFCMTSFFYSVANQPTLKHEVLSASSTLQARRWGIRCFDCCWSGRCFSVAWKYFSSFLVYKLVSEKSLFSLQVVFLFEKVEDAIVCENTSKYLIVSSVGVGIVVVAIVVVVVVIGVVVVVAIVVTFFLKCFVLFHKKILFLFSQVFRGTVPVLASGELESFWRKAERSFCCSWHPSWATH